MKRLILFLEVSYQLVQRRILYETNGARGNSCSVSAQLRSVAHASQGIDIHAFYLFNGQAFFFIQIDLQVLEVTSLTKVTAFEIGHYKLRIDLDDGDPVVDEGDYVVIWKLCEDGVWRKHVDIWNTSLPLE